MKCLVKIQVDEELVSGCRAMAADIATEVQGFIDVHTSVGVERTVARAYGIEGLSGDCAPTVNVLVDRVHEAGIRINENVRPAEKQERSGTAAR